MRKFLSLALVLTMLSGCASPSAEEASETSDAVAPVATESPTEVQAEEEEVVQLTVAGSLLNQLQAAYPQCGYNDDFDRGPTFYEQVCRNHYPLPTSEEPGLNLYSQLPSPRTPVGLQEHLLKIYQYAQELAPVERENIVLPSADVQMQQIITEIENRLLAIWRPLGITEVSGKRIWVNETDWDVWQEWAKGNGANSQQLALWDKQSGLFGSHCWVTAESYCVSSDFFNGEKRTTTVLGSKFNGNNVYETAAHEMIHTLQGEIQFRDKCWWTEGTAMMFSDVIGYSGRVEQVRLLKERTGIQKYSESAVQAMYSNDTICDFDDEARYSVGMFAVEYLLLNWTLETFFDFWLKADSVGWDDAVRNVLGTEPDALDAAFAAHLLQTAKGEVADADYQRPWDKKWVQELLAEEPKRVGLKIMLEVVNGASYPQFLVEANSDDQTEGAKWLNASLTSGRVRLNFGTFRQYDVVKDAFVAFPMGQQGDSPSFNIPLQIPLIYDPTVDEVLIVIDQTKMTVSGKAIYGGQVEFKLD
jgi:hypothetical protein